MFWNTIGMILILNLPCSVFSKHSRTNMSSLPLFNILVLFGTLNRAIMMPKRLSALNVSVCDYMCINK